MNCSTPGANKNDLLAPSAEFQGHALHWRHNDHDGISNHQTHGCLLNRSFGRRSKKTSKLRVTGLCAGNSPGHVNSPHKGPVTRKMFPFDDVIMWKGENIIIMIILYNTAAILDCFTILYWSSLLINPLRAKFFRGNIKHIFTFSVFPPHWYDTGGWNPSSHKTRTYPFYIVNIMTAGVLATQGARTSTVMILT